MEIPNPRYTDFSQIYFIVAGGKVVPIEIEDIYLVICKKGARISYYPKGNPFGNGFSSLEEREIFTTRKEALTHLVATVYEQVEQESMELPEEVKTSFLGWLKKLAG